jgi:SulP family sulfate permease
MATQSLEHPKTTRSLSRFVPILGWLPRYNRLWLVADILAGITLWGLVVPEGMAYAGVAGLPPQFGLYTLVASLLVYALLGSSPHLSVGATSATAALIASTVVALGVTTADMGAYQAYAVALVLVIGAIFLVAGLARLGWVTQFLSKPVMDGFVTGLAIFVAVGQLNKLFGVEKGEGNVFQKLFTVIEELPEANWVTIAVGASALALLFLLPRWNKKIPAGLVVLFGSIAVSTALNLNANYGVDVAGVLPQGLPSISLPQVSLGTVFAMILPAMGIFLVAFSEALGAGREFAEKHHYEIDPDQELNAHAITNLASGLFGGMIAGGGMSATAVKEGAGGRTQVANLVAWGVTVVTLLFLTPLFTSLPEAVLAALIIHAVWHIIAARKLERVRLVSRTEFILGVIALLGVLFIDVLPGMVIGLVASLLLMIYQSSRPHLSSLGRIPGTPGAYSDLKRHPENTAVPGILILRLDAPMYYANALTVRGQIKALVADVQPPPHAIVLDAAAQDALDITSGGVLKGLVSELKDRGIDIYVAEVHAPVREFVQRAGLAGLIGEDHEFPTVEAAVRFIEASAGTEQANPAERPGSDRKSRPEDPV